MRYLILRIFRQFRYDKRLIGMIFIAPLLVLTLVSLLMGAQSVTPAIAADLPAPLVTQLARQEVSLVSGVTRENATRKLEDKTIDAWISLDGSKLTVQVLENNALKVAAVTKAVQSSIKSLAGASKSGMDMEVSMLHGDPDASLFDSMGYIMLGYIAFFFVFLLSGVSFIRERSLGTLERFILAPVRRWEIIAGYTTAFGTLAVIQSLVILLYSEYVLHMHIGSALPMAVLVIMLLALNGVGIGMLVSIASNSEFQVMQFIPVLVLPQIFFSGLIPLDTMPYHLGNLAWIMPVYYACDAMKHLIIYRSSLQDVSLDLLVLTGLFAVLTVINTMALRHYRKI